MCADCRVVDLITTEKVGRHPRPLTHRSMDRFAADLRSQARARGPRPGRLLRRVGGAVRRRPGRAPVAALSARRAAAARCRVRHAAGGVEPPVGRHARAMDPEAAQQEYWDLFVGTGKCGDQPARLALAHRFHDGKAAGRAAHDARRGWGLSRKAESELVEDHVSALFETMRLLIEGAGRRAARSPIEEQQALLRSPHRRAGCRICALL